MRLLVVEDDERLNETICALLQREGFDADRCYDGGSAKQYIEKGGYELILLDRMIPNTDGLTLLKNMRRCGDRTPVIMVTALGTVGDRVTGLDSGADDYIVKPFAPEELLARVRALLRRPPEQLVESLLHFGDLSLNMKEHRLLCGDSGIALSHREAAFMELMIKNGGRVVTRDTIYSCVWGMDSFVENGNIDNYIRLLRRRLTTVDSRCALVNVPRIGYTLADGSGSADGQ